MDLDRKRLGEEVRKIVRTLAPLDHELTLADTIPNPMKTHVDGLTALRLDGIGRDTHSTRVVA